MLIWNYLKSTFRSITRNKFYMGLNMASLTIGLVCSMIILLTVYHDFSYDYSHKKHNRIYRIESDVTVSGKRDYVAVTSFILGPKLKQEIPEIESAVRVIHDSRLLLSYGTKEFYEDGFIYSDSDVFQVFTHHFVYGNPENALQRPYTIVLTQSLARKYFDDENPVGKFLKLDASKKVEVTGVIQDLPGNLHLRFTGIISLRTLEKEWGPGAFDQNRPNLFWSLSCYTYLLIKEGKSIQDVENHWPAFYEKYLAGPGMLVNGKMKLAFLPLSKVHFHSKAEYDFPRGNLSYIYIFIWGAIFMLLIASINYMNLATARASLRAKEIGVRKVVGGRSGNIRSQFLGESVFLAYLSLVFSLSIVEILIPFLNRLTGYTFYLSSLFQWPLFPIILSITLVIGLLSGIYPAVFLSSFQPVEVLKGRTGRILGSGILRKVLVVFQFTISIVMITMNIIASEQVNFMLNKDMGFNRSNTLVIFVQDTIVRAKLPDFRAELLNHPEFQSVSISSIVPGITPTKSIMMVEQNGKLNQMVLNLVLADSFFIQTFDLKLIAGTNFRECFKPGNEDEYILNETAVDKLGWSKQALGRKLNLGVEMPGQVYREGRVIGVVKDYNYRSLQNQTEPLVIMAAKKYPGMVSIKYQQIDSIEVIKKVSQIYRKYDPVLPLDYFILDQFINSQYSGEVHVAQLFSYLAILCIFIALLGLLGLSSFVANQRTREIGIRKVMGASVTDILSLLNREFVLLVAIAFAISVPLAWHFANLWLKSFAYHINIGLWPFLISGVFSLIIALLTTNIYTLKAANQNPAGSIKCDC